MTIEELPLKEKINFETAKIPWKELEIFFAKGKLLYVSEDQDLVSVAKKIAENQAKKIEKLILNKNISFATAEWVKNNCQAITPIWAVVVAPYVICQIAN